MNSSNTEEDTCPNNVTPAVALNDELLQPHTEHPLTTEEPLGSPELAKEVQEINKVDAEDIQVPPAEIIAKTDPNLFIPGSCSGSEDERSILDDQEQPHIIPDTNKSPLIVASHAPATTETTTTTASGALDISPIYDPSKEQVVLVPSDDDDDSDGTDDELMRITEANRFIPPIKGEDEPTTPFTTATTQTKPSTKSLRSRSVSTRRHLLVFSDHPKETKKSDRIIVHNHYGAGPDGKLEGELRPTRRKRAYLVACDFSEESFHAIEWTMGTMMRDGDQLYVVTVVNREDNPEAVKQAGLSLAKELKKASDAVTEEAKKTLGQMLLFDVELITYAICGRVKDVMFNLIEELPLTMVVCGSRGRGTVKGLLMGSISTYLVHKSPVPVTVIRPQKKKKAAQKKHLHPGALSQSVKTGQLAVDEVSKSAATTGTTTDPAAATPATTTTTTPPTASTTTTTS